ncbi:hypothetical protein DPMN_096788 [Dreissena polymorpha]|uniref:Ig-like domain-containing protein n=2 Tax=Dreissena polymorpha TaxID=45954 RepID=A0A9D4R5R9_DREPO|nr:hypothetical protein DPMN_096788 [Dreissena polymorpha]
MVRLFAIFKVRPVDFLCFLVYLVTQAIIVLYILLTVATVIYSGLYITFFENFFYSFDENTTANYAEGFFYPKVLNNTLYFNPVVHELLYYQNTEGKYVLLQDKIHKRVQEPKLPYFHYSIKRYLGEDVDLLCGYRFIKGKKAKHRRTVWSLNGTSIQSLSNRHSANETISQCDDSYMNIQSTLTIRALQKSDFGEYECRVQSFYYLNDKSSKWAQKPLIKETYLIGINSLEEIEARTILFSREVGNLIASRKFFWYHTFEDISEVRIEYTINCQPVDVTCPGYSTLMCSFGAQVVNFNIYMFEKIDLPIIDIVELKGASQLKAAVIHYCMCPSAFGIHRVNFIRYVNDSTRNKFVLMDIQHPFVLVVLPRSAPSFFRFSDDTAVYAGMKELVRSNQPLEFIEMKFESLIGFISANEQKLLLIANFIQNAIFVCLVVILCIVVRYMSSVYFTYILRKPVRRILYRLPNIKYMPTLEDFVYDVYISHSEQEYEFVTQTLLPFLQEDVHVNVCFTASDAINPKEHISMSSSGLLIRVVK